MLRNFIEEARARFGSSAKWRGAYGYNICNQNGTDITGLLTRQRLDADGFAFGPNRVVDQGINYIMNAALRGEGVLSAFYIAPFAANVAPAAGLTAASFTATMTEFINYDETARRPWVTDAAATAMFLENAAAPALFTVAGGAQTTIWGAGLLSASPKSSTAGVLISAQRRASVLNAEDDFQIRIRYRLAGSSS